MSQNRTITLEPIEHKYTDDRGSVYTSVTTLIGKFHEKFDDILWSYYKAYGYYNYKVCPKKIDQKMIGFNSQANMFGDGLTDYRHIGDIVRTAESRIKEKAQSIRELWSSGNKTSLKFGSKTHDNLEFGINTFYPKRGDCTYALKEGLELNYDNAFVNHNDLLSSDINVKFPTIFKYLYDLITDGFVIFTEVLIYHPDERYLVCGKADVVAVRGKDVIVADWKTNKESLTKEAGYFKKITDYDTGIDTYTGKFVSLPNKKMYKPIDHIPDCAYWHYALQLNMYGYLISLFGFNILKYELWHLVPLFSNEGKLIDLGDGERLLGTPKYYRLPVLTNEVKALIETTKIN